MAGSMKKYWAQVMAQVKCIKLQVFLSYFLVLTVSFLVLGLSVTLAARELLIEQIGGSRLDLLRQISERANTVKTNATTLSGLYRYELAALQNDSLTPEEINGALAQQKEKYSGVFGPVGLDHDPVVVTGEGTFSSLPEEALPPYLEDQLWYRRLRRNLLDGDPETVMFSSTFPAAGGEHYQFAAAQMIERGGEKCVLLVLMDEQVLQRLYEPALTEGGDIYIYDQNGLIVSHSNKKMLGKQFVDPASMAALYGTNCSAMIKKLGCDYLLTTYLDENTGWTIVEEIPANIIFGVLDRMYLLIYTILAVCLAASLWVALYQSRRIARPLMRLSGAMDAFGGRDFTPLPTDTGTQEIDCLSQSFNHMAGEISHLMDAVTEQERQKRAAEINFLRAQINPHFLYNMLFSIRCTVEIGKSEQAVQMIEAFTDLLKTTLKMTGDTVPLTDEFENTRKYLVVQKLRYGEKVHFEMDMAPGTEACRVPPLILQPLVENAIFHGLEAKDDADMVVVASTLEGSDLLLTVTDDGAGMTQEELEKVTADMQARQNGRERQSDSIGLANVYNRIRLNYGEAYGMYIQSVPDIGTTITLRLPAQWEKDTEQGVEQSCGF